MHIAMHEHSHTRHACGVPRADVTVEVRTSEHATRTRTHVRAHEDTDNLLCSRGRTRGAAARAQVTTKLNQLGKHAIGDHQLQMTLLELKHIKATNLLQVFLRSAGAG